MNERIKNVTDVIHGIIYLSELELEIISTPLFNRLHYVSQTSTVYLTYPSNNSKRFDYCVGTMKLCGDIFFYSMSNAEVKTINSFFTDFNNEINKIIKSWNKSMPEIFKNAYGDENLAKGFREIEDCNFVGGIYKQYIPSNIEISYRNLFVVLFEAIRVCGLLHDVGHPPYSHIVESGLKMAYEDAPENSSLKKALKNIMRKKSELHEEIGNLIFDGICHSVFDNIKNTELEYRFFYILVLEVAKDILSEKNNYFRDIHRIIAGALDGDRLDNINRDAFMTGFDANLFDYTQILNSMILLGNSKNGYEFCPDIKTLIAVEDCFSKRWKNYRRMTHHHRVIKTNYMLQMVIYYLSIEYCQLEKTMDNDMDSLFLPYDISGLWKPILQTSSNKMQIIRFIQWNDNWLMTVLQKKYLEMFLHAEADKKETPLYYFLEELIENKKNYKSLVKRYEDYMLIDEAFRETIVDYLKEAIEKYRKFNQKIKEAKNSSKEILQKEITQWDMTGFIEGLTEINFDDCEGAFLTSKISQLVSCFLPKTNLFDVIGDEIKTTFFEKYKDVIVDCFLVSKRLKTGTDNVLCLYDNNIHEKKRFIDISHIDETLKLEQSYIPEFYMYVMWKNKDTIDNAKLLSIKRDIGFIVAEKTKNYIENTFMKYLQFGENSL